MVDIERGPAVLPGRETVLIKNIYERILSVTSIFKLLLKLCDSK